VNAVTDSACAYVPHSFHVLDVHWCVLGDYRSIFHSIARSFEPLGDGEHNVLGRISTHARILLRQICNFDHIFEVMTNRIKRIIANLQEHESQTSPYKSDRVTTEGDELYYELRGQGQPLLMISGGGGDGGSYSLVAEILSDEYKIITYDRRANARSTMKDPQNFEVSQQSRDAVAVLRAAGEKSAFVFGNSSGAVIALDMAKTHPQSVQAIVAHEPPLARVHPDTRKWQRFFAGIYYTAFRYGATMAMLRFAFGLGLLDHSVRQTMKAHKAMRGYREKSGNRYLNRKITIDFFLQQELLPVTNYLLDIETIKKNGVRVFMAAGKRSLDKKRFYARTTQILAKKLGCQLVTFPGHHGSFIDMPDEFAATLRSVLHKAQGVNQ
jgi:pimeloyl-ACP methyl ester carboxylesterase